MKGEFSDNNLIQVAENRPDNEVSLTGSVEACPAACVEQAGGQEGENGLAECLPQEGINSHMAESVTRHVQNPDCTYSIVACGIDTLDIGLYVEWNEKWEDLLSSFHGKKELAFGTDGILVQQKNIREHLFLPGGKQPNYRYHLQFPEYHLFIGIAEKPKKGTPNLYASLNSEAIWDMSIPGVILLIWKDITSFGGIIKQMKPSRIDFCADMRIPGGLTEEFIKTHMVSKSNKTTKYEENGILETFYLGGKGAAVKLRIYDKGKEVIKKDTEKRWLSIWNVDDPTDIWRIEYQLRRPLLKQFKIDTIDDIERKAGDLWRYLTERWFSLRIPDNEKTERRTIHPLWNEIISCAGQFGDGIGMKREYRKNDHLTSETIIARIAGFLVTFGAREAIMDIERAITRVGYDLALYFRKKNFLEEVKKKAIKSGISLQDIEEIKQLTKEFEGRIS